MATFLCSRIVVLLEAVVLILLLIPALIISWQCSSSSRISTHVISFSSLVHPRATTTSLLLASNKSNNNGNNRNHYETQPNPLFALTLSQLPRTIRHLLEYGSTTTTTKGTTKNNTIQRTSSSKTNVTQDSSKSTSHIILLSNTGEINNFISSLPLSSKHKAAAKFGLSRECIQTVPSILTEQQCRTLRQWATDKIYHHPAPKSIDTVDGCPEYQVPIDEPTLIQLIGREQVQTLHKLPLQFLQEASKLEEEEEQQETETRQQRTSNNDSIADRNTTITSMAGDDDSLSLSLLDSVDVGYFIRSYNPFNRPFLGFHVDDCDATVNVCLSHPQEHQGGDLLALSNGKLIRLHPRPQGSATIHPWYCCHGVTSVTTGERWSLIAFFSNSSPIISSSTLHKGFYNNVYSNNNHVAPSHKNIKKKKR